jgi:hypothetical protein
MKINRRSPLSPIPKATPVLSASGMPKPKYRTVNGPSDLRYEDIAAILEVSLEVAKASLAYGQGNGDLNLSLCKERHEEMVRRERREQEDLEEQERLERGRLSKGLM